jgi:KDO2-lipid IV(A) lauroyltransferase
VVTVYPEIELSRSADSDEALVQDTKEFSSRIEKHIQDHPEQWLWMHRRWKRA